MKLLISFFVLLFLILTSEIYPQLFSLKAEINLTPDITLLGDIDNDGVFEIYSLNTQTVDFVVTIFEAKNLTEKYKINRIVGVPSNLEPVFTKLIDLNGNGIKDFWFNKLENGIQYFGFLDPFTNQTIFEYQVSSDVKKLLLGDFDGDKKCDLLVKLNNKLLLFTSNISVTSIDNSNEIDLPIDYKLEQNFPNPFNNSTTIQYSITQPDRISIYFYNVNGELVNLYENEHNTAGKYSYNWNGQNNRGELLASGVYFYQMRTGKNTSAKKMILLK